MVVLFSPRRNARPCSHSSFYQCGLCHGRRRGRFPMRPLLVMLLLITGASLWSACHVTNQNESNQGSTHQKISVYLLTEPIQPAQPDERDLTSSQQHLPFGSVILKTIPSFPEQQVVLEHLMAQQTLTHPNWDWEDRRMRQAYHVDYVSRSDVARTLSHRRLLEAFLQTTSSSQQHDNKNNTTVTLVLEDDHENKISNWFRRDDSTVGSLLVKVRQTASSLAGTWDVIFLSSGVCDELCHGSKKFRGNPVSFESVGEWNHVVCASPAAYLVSPQGAEKILQYSLPIVLPYDHTLLLLARTGILNMYYSPLNILGDKAPNPALCRDHGSRQPIPPSYDQIVWHRITSSPVQELVSIATRRLKDAPTMVHAEQGRLRLMAELCAQGKTFYCSLQDDKEQEDTHVQCQKLGGNPNLDLLADPGPATQKFLQRMSTAGLEGVVIWGPKTTNVAPQHEQLFVDVYKALEAALMYSPKRLHLCYVAENPNLDLGRHLFHDDLSRGRLAHSLVFASTKDRMLAQDPGFLALPIEATSRYIFYGETPRPHTVLKRIGFAVEWETWGSDEEHPLIESDAFQRVDPWNCTDGCQVDLASKTKRCPDLRLLIQPRAATYTPTEIQVNIMNLPSRAKFIGQPSDLVVEDKISDCNVENILRFTKGCGEIGIAVIGHGETTGQPMLLENVRSELLHQGNFFMENTSKSLLNSFEETGGLFGPAFQGHCHFVENSSRSFIADHVMDLISIGMYPMTNNKASYELLGHSSAVVFDRKLENLCKTAVEHRPSIEGLYDSMELVAREHTIISRLNFALDFIIDALPNPSQRSGQDFNQDTTTSMKGKRGVPFPVLDTRFFEPALKDCGYDTECVLSRVPVHPSRNCSLAVFVAHHRTGNGLASTLQQALPCSGSTRPYDYVRENYEPGRPILHFIRNPLEVVVSGYQYHLVSNEEWLERTKKLLHNRSLEKGLKAEFRGLGEHFLGQSMGIHELMKQNRTTQQDFFTIRLDQVREERLFSLTMQAIQVWLGISNPISTAKLRDCCFSPKGTESLDGKPLLRENVMKEYGGEIRTFRRKFDFPDVGLESESHPKRQIGAILLRVLAVVVLGTFSVSVAICSVVCCSSLASLFLRHNRSICVDAFKNVQESDQTGQARLLSAWETSKKPLPAHSNLLARFCYESARQTPLFALHSPFAGAELDVQEAFAPSPIWRTRSIRLGMFVYSVYLLRTDIDLMAHRWFYMAFLSHWATALTSCYLLVSTCVAFAGPLRKVDEYSRPSALVCVHWASFISAVTIQFVITTVFWSTMTHYFFHIANGTQRYHAFIKHGGFFLLIVWEGLVYSCIPLRVKLVVFPLAITLCFGAWTFYQSHFGPSNPIYYGQEHWDHPEDDDAVYAQFNWQKRPVESSLSWVYGFIFTQIHFIALWMGTAWLRS